MALARRGPAVDTNAMLRWILPLLALLSCKPSQPSQGPHPPTSGTTPVYEVTVTKKGFEPTRIEVPPGRDVLLRFTRKVENTCADSVIVQGDPVKHMLPLDKPVDVRLTSPKSGEVSFACGMEMYRGALVVTGG